MRVDTIRAVLQQDQKRISQDMIASLLPQEQPTSSALMLVTAGLR